MHPGFILEHSHAHVIELIWNFTTDRDIM